ncbi:hypothetical protein ACH6CV_16815 [Bacillota bacterium Meth-B3]
MDDRLTTWYGAQVGLANGVAVRYMALSPDTNPWIDKAIKHLAAYEDTGLMPDEVAALKDEIASLRAKNERLRAGVADSDKLICSLIERYEFDGDSEDANPCEWCSRNNCDSCRRMTDDDSLKVRFEMADLGFMEARAALEGGQQ